MQRYSYPVIMISNIDPVCLRTCQRANVPSDDDILVRRELGTISGGHVSREGSKSTAKKKNGKIWSVIIAKGPPAKKEERRIPR